MSGFNTLKRRRTVTNDYGDPGFTSDVSGGELAKAVEILPNINTHRVAKAGDRLPQFVNEPQQSVDILVSSQNRVSGTPYNFTADIGSTVFRPRLVSVDTVVVPKIYNINPNNNQVRMQMAFVATDDYDGAGISLNEFNTGLGAPSPIIEFTLPTGYYDERTFSSVFASLFSGEIDNGSKFAGWEVFPGYGFTEIIDPTSVLTLSPRPAYNFAPPTVDFVGSDNTFVFSAVYNAIATLNGTIFKFGGALFFWFLDDCSFIRRGKNFVPFPTSTPLSPLGVPGWAIPTVNSFNNNVIDVVTPAASAQISSIYNPLKSGLSGLQYTRFITLSSDALNRFSYDESRVTRVGDGGGRGKIIAVIDTSLFQINGVEFAGTFLPAQYPNAAVINVNNAQGQLEQFLDFIARDEYGDVLDNVFENNEGIGITFWLKIAF